MLDIPSHCLQHFILMTDLAPARITGCFIIVTVHHILAGILDHCAGSGQNFGASHMLGYSLLSTPPDRDWGLWMCLWGVTNPFNHQAQSQSTLEGPCLLHTHPMTARESQGRRACHTPAGAAPESGAATRRVCVAVTAVPVQPPPSPTLAPVCHPGYQASWLA